MKVSVLLIVIFWIFSFCEDRSNKDITNEGKIKYFDLSKNSYISVDKLENGVLQGHHCFISFNGERIDCCVDDANSFELHFRDGRTYKGELISCYNDKIYKVEVQYFGDYIVFSFIGEEHPFMPFSEKFYKE